MRRLQCLFTSDKPTSHNIHKCIFTISQHQSVLQYSTPLFQRCNTDRLQKTTTFIPIMDGKKPQMVQKIVIVWSYYIYIYIYTVCPGGNVPDFGRMFLKLKYTDINQNTYIRSWTVTEIKAIETCGLLAVPRTVPVSRDVLPVHCACPSFSLQPGQVHSRCDLVSKVGTVTVNWEL